MLCCDWFTYTTIPQSFATAKNRSRSPAKVRHIGWHLAVAREYLSTSVASTVSIRIYIYIRGYIPSDVAFLSLHSRTSNRPDNDQQRCTRVTDGQTTDDRLFWYI